MMMMIIIIIIIIRTAFLLCVTFQSLCAYLRPYLRYGSQANVRAEANKCIKKLGAKCCEMLRIFLFVLMLLSPSSAKFIFQHNFEILYDLTRYFRRNVFWESKDTAETLSCFYILLTVHLGIVLDNDQLDTQVCVRCTGWEVPSQPVHRTATYWEWRYQMLHQYNSNSWWWACNARNM